MINTKIVRISIQRHVVIGEVLNRVTAYDGKGYKIGREEKIYRSKALGDDEARHAVNAGDNVAINRETLGPGTGKW